jgi:hypothetical protein
MIPTAEEFRVTLRPWMQGAEHASETTVEINSGQLHREVGGYPGQNHRMPMCCAVMRSEMSRPTDMKMNLAVLTFFLLPGLVVSGK